MDLEYLKSELTKAGWKKLDSGSHMEFDFDLIGVRYFTLTKWNILVKTIPLLNQDTVAQWEDTFKTINKKSKSLFWGKCFLLCLLAKDVSEDLLESIRGDSFGALGLFRLKGGGGNIFIADLKNKRVYGKVPALPYDVHKYSKSVKKIIVQSINK